MTYFKIEAKNKLRKEAFDYIARGSGEEATMSANREAFAKWKIRPRVLRDVSVCDFSVSLFGKTMKSPILLAPIGVQKIAHPEGELASARAAAAMGVPFILSSLSSYSMEEISEEIGDHPRWFQLYCSSEDSVTQSLVKRAEANGYSAIVITVDTPILGVRKTDYLNGYSPIGEGNGCGNYFPDPAFCRLLEDSPSADKEAAILKQMDIFNRPALSWDELQKIRTYTTLPILLKGIVHPDDAQLALDYGVDGLIVSNHGGRQLDHSVSTLDALEDIVKVIQGRIPVLIDSGFRQGTDVLKALALGANAVLLGRPYIYGLAVDGQAGVQRVITELLHDFEVSMKLTGARSISELDASILVKS